MWSRDLPRLKGEVAAERLTERFSRFIFLSFKNVGRDESSRRILFEYYSLLFYIHRSINPKGYYTPW